MTGETHGPGYGANPYGPPDPVPRGYAPVPRPYPPGQRPHEWAPGLRASEQERDRAVDVLKAAFGEGRLTRDELDARTGHAMAAAYRADLAPIVADLPGGEAFAVVPPGRPTYVAPPPTNNLAIASLICSVLGFGLPGVVLGHVARGQIRARGERGGGLALAGLIIGWAQIGLWLLIGLLLVAVVASPA